MSGRKLLDPTTYVFTYGGGHSSQILIKREFFSTDFRKILEYQISRKSFQWEPSCFMRTGEQIWRRFSKFCEGTFVKQSALLLLCAGRATHQKRLSHDTGGRSRPISQVKNEAMRDADRVPLAQEQIHWGSAFNKVREVVSIKEWTFLDSLHYFQLSERDLLHASN